MNDRIVGFVAEEGFESPSSATRRTLSVGIISIALLPLFLLLVFVPNNAVVDRRSTPHLSVVGEFFPQGWAFFTRQPRAANISVFRQTHDGSWERLSSTSNANPSSAFGANRSTRTEQYEIESISSRARDVDWTPCSEEEALKCLSADLRPSKDIQLHGLEPRFCGTAALVRQEPVPWAWAGSVEEMPAEIKVLNVDCIRTGRK